MMSNERQVWRPRRTGRAPGLEHPRPERTMVAPTWKEALGRGLSARCPVCGRGRLFEGYLSVVSRCAVCGSGLGAVPADDAPPWVTMFIVLHMVVGLVVLLGRTTTLDTSTTSAIVLPVAFLLCLALLRPVKGSVVGLLIKLDVKREDQEPS